MARLNGARLLMLEKGEDKVVREIPVRTSQVQIGSNPTKNTIRLNSAGVEESHCKIFVKNDKVFIANYSAKNPISVDKTVVPKRAVLVDGSILEICGTRFRWKFDDSKLARPEKTKKVEQTPTSSKIGNRRRTTMVRKKQGAAVVASVAGGSGKKPIAKKVVQQKTPTYTLPKNHKQLLKNIRKRFTVHNIMTRQNSDDGADEEDMECEDSDNLVEHPEQAESPKPVTPQKPPSTTSSAANTPFFTPEPEKENSIPVSKTPKTPMLQLETSAMMILSYTPAIGSRSKANIQKTPLSASKSAQRFNYLTPKNENVSVSGTPLKSKAGNSMYLIDLTTPNSGHSSFVCSPMLDTTASSVGSPKVGWIDLTTPSPKKVKTPASALKSTQQKTLLKSALKNASRTPLRSALRTATGTPVTPKAVPKISLNDTPTKSATSTRSSKTPASGSVRGGSIRSKLETPISSKKQPNLARNEEASPYPTVAPELTEPKGATVMTTDELFDTLVGRQSVVKTYERKSTSPKKTPCPLVLADDTSDMPKTDIDLWVESVVATVTSPEPVNMDTIIRKPNQTTQVRSSQYSDITPHESFVEGTAVAITSEAIDTQPGDLAVDVNSPDELDNMADKPTISNSNRRSETPLASKIARSLGNKRQTIGNFFTNIFGKLTVSPVTRISIADDSTNQAGEEEQTNGEDSDGSEDVYHDSETSHAANVPPEQPADEPIASSPKLRQSLRDTRKFIGNAWTSLNTSRPQLDNTGEIDESLLLSDTYNETQPDVASDSAADEIYDLTDLSSRPATTQPPMSAAKTPTHRRSVQSAGAFDISPLATPLESTLNKTVSHELDRDETGSFVISPDAATRATATPITPVLRRSQQNVNPTTSSTSSRRRQTLQQAESVNVSIAESDAVETAETDAPKDPLQEPSCSRNTSIHSFRTSPYQSMNDQVNEFKEEVSRFDISKTAPEAEGEMEEIHKNNSKEHPDSSDDPPISTSLAHLDTSEMEPLEVTDNHESEFEVDLPSTPPTNDLVGGKGATRNSIASMQTFTPKAATTTSTKIPLSESKLPLRGLRNTTAGTRAETPQKVIDESAPEINLPEDFTANIDNEAQIDETAADPESVVEQSRKFDKSISSCVEQIKVSNTESENVAHDEIAQSQVDLPSASREASQAAAVLSVESVNESSRQELPDSTANLEQTVVNENLSKSLSTTTATPRTETSLSKVPMSESMLPLCRLKATEIAKLDLTVEESPNEQVSALENCNVTTVEPEAVVAAVESNDEIEPSIVGNVSRIPSTPKELNQSAKRTPASTIPASPVRFSRSSARSTPQKASSSTPKPTPSGTALLKRVMQKVKASATKAASAPSPKPELNDSEADASLRLDQFYQTPTLRVTRGKVPHTSTPNVADASLKLDELYKTPARATRGNVATASSVKSRVASPKGAVNDSIDEESLVNASLHPDNINNTPLPSTTPLENHELSVVDSAPSENRLESSAVDTSLNLHEMYNTPAKELLTQLQDVVETTVLPTAEADMSLNLQQMHLTPTRLVSTAKNVETSEESGNAEKSCNLQEMVDDTMSSEIVSDPAVELNEASELQTSVDMSLNHQELQKTPARSLRTSAQHPAVKNSATLMEGAVQADVSLNLQQLYQTPARPTRQSLAVKNTLQPAVDAEASKVDEGVEPQPNSDITLNLKELNKTPARSLRESLLKSTIENFETPKESESGKLHKTPARLTRQSSVAKSTPKPVGKELQPSADMSLNLNELYKTPARVLRTNAQQSAVNNSGTTKEGVTEADVSLNLERLYKTPASSTRQSSTVKSIPHSAVRNDTSKVDVEHINQQPNADMSLNLQELYKTPVRTLRGVSQLTPSAGPAKVSTPVIEAVRPELEADFSLNLEQLYKTPARLLRGTAQLSAVKPVKVSEITPQKDFENSAVDVTPTAELSKIERTPIAKVSDAEMTLNLEHMYQTPVRQSSTDEKAGSTAIAQVEADVSLNLDQLYKTPARTLHGVTQLSSSGAKAEAEVSLNLQEMCKTPARALRGTKAQQSGTPMQESADMSLNLQDLYKTPAQTHQVTDVTVQAMVDEPNLNVGSLFKTPARTTRAKLPRSSAKVTLQTASPLRTPRSASKCPASASVQEQSSVSMIESELASSIVGDSIDMGSESDGLVTGKAISSSTPFNPRIRKSTLVAAVGMMSPLSSSGDASTAFASSQMHTEAIGITTIDRSASESISTTTVDQMQSMAGVFVAAQSRLLYDESCSETMQGDPLQMTNAVEPLEDITLNETTQRSVAESLLEQNETLIEATISEQFKIDAPKSADRSSVSTTTTINEVEKSVQNGLPKAEVITPTRITPQSPAIKVNESTETLGNKSAVESTSVRKVVEPIVEICINLHMHDEHKTPAQMSQNDSQLSKAAGIALNASSAINEHVAITKSPAASPKDPSTPVTEANVTASKTSIMESTPTPFNMSKQRVPVTVNVSINEQELVAASTLSEIPSETLVVGSPIAEVKSADTVADVSVSVDPVNTSSLLSEKMDDESVPEKSIARMSVGPESSDAASDSATTAKGPDAAAAAYLDSLGVDPVLLQQIHERVDTLERELAEMNDITQSSSTFLERSDEQSLDSQESEVEAKLQDKTPKPMKRRLYTKTAPDDSTPERRESIGNQRVSSFYTESDSDRKAADTSSEIEEPKKVEVPVKVLPSRASRRKITTLSEEALAGASPELKFVKPKPPKVATTENPPQNDTSEAEQSDQETSLGRRKVVFNEHIQVKEINSPAFIGEIIKKTSVRGRGRNNNQAVTVTVDQHEGQSIKPATKRTKIVEFGKVAEFASGNCTTESTEVVPDRVETVKPGRNSAAEDEAEMVVEDLPKQSEEIVAAPVDEPTAKRSRAKKAPAPKRTGSRKKIPVELAAEDRVEAELQEGTNTPDSFGAIPDNVETVELGKVVESKLNSKKVVPVVEEPAKQSEEIVEESIDETDVKRSRAKKAPAPKRTGSRKKIPVELATEDRVEAELKEGTSTAVDPIVQEPLQLSEEIYEASEDEPAAKRSRSKKAPAPKRTGSRTKAESQAEHTSTDEHKNEVHEAAPDKPSTKRSRRGAKNASDVTETTSKEPADEEKNEAEHKVEEPDIKRVRHTHESNAEPAVGMMVDDQTNDVEKTDDEQATTKATSRSRRGKKQVPAKNDAVQTESKDPPADAQETEKVDKSKEVKSRSRRGGKKNDSSTLAKIKEPERGENSSAVAERKTDNDVENPESEEEMHVIPENTSKAKAQPRSRRGAKGKAASAEEIVQGENVPADVQESKSDTNPSEEVTSSADGSVGEKSGSHSKAAAKKVIRRGRGAAKNDTVESSDLPEASATNSLAVENAIVDSTNHDDEPSNVAVDDVKSGAKRSRRGVAKDEAEPAEAANIEQVNEPASKRSRRAPKSKVIEEAHAQSADQAEVMPKTTVRSRRGQKLDSVIEKTATENERQETSKVEKSAIEEKPIPRGRGAKREPAEEKPSTRMASPPLPPPVVDEHPVKRVGRQTTKRAPRKASNSDPVPVEMSMNESHMVKTMLPESHTSTPLIKNPLNTDAGEVPSGTRGRRAVANPVIAALIEESTPRTRARRGASATPEVQVETPNTPAKRGRGRGAAPKAKVIEKESESTVTEAPQTSTAVDESEPSTSTARSRGKKTAKVDKEIVEQTEPVVEAEPATKRTRKVPVKLRDDVDDDTKAQPSRSRRGAKVKAEEPNSAAADDEVSSAGPSKEEPKRKARAAAANRAVEKKASDLKEADEEEAPKSPPPKRTRKGAR